MTVIRWGRDLTPGGRDRSPEAGAPRVPVGGALAIRPARWPDDAAAVTEVAAAAADESLRLSGAGLNAELRSRPGRTVEGWIAWWTSAQPARPVGLVLVCQVAGGGTSIAWLVVARGFRRRGIATALVAVASDRAAQLGARYLTAESRADWPARHFWRARGFAEITRCGPRPD